MSWMVDGGVGGGGGVESLVVGKQDLSISTYKAPMQPLYKETGEQGQWGGVKLDDGAVSAGRMRSVLYRRSDVVELQDFPAPA